MAEEETKTTNEVETASDPIPVGGEPIDQASFFQGWLVGRRLAGMRGKTKPNIKPVLPESGVDPDTREITDTWEQVQQAIEEGVYGNRYQLGDTKSFAMADGTAVAMQIVAFDADNKADGSKAAISWVVQYVITQHSMNTTSTNENGWAASAMRVWLQGEFYDKIPDNVKACIVSVNKTYYDYTTQTTKFCTDNLWLPSAREIFGGTTYEDSGADYTGYFSSNQLRVKYNASGTADNWFLRTAYSGSSAFRTVYTQGSASYTNASNERGVVVGFCT